MTTEDYRNQCHKLASQFFAARATVEQRLLDHGHNKNPITPAEAFELANMLGKADAIARELNTSTVFIFDSEGRHTASAVDNPPQEPN